MHGAAADQPDVAITEASLLAHPVEFGDRSARRKHDGTNVFCTGLEEEAGRDLLVTHDVFINFLRGDDQLPRLIVVMVVMHAVEIICERGRCP
ncbi:hypothetical protein D9M68_903210 [compost metagenome]